MSRSLFVIRRVVSLSLDVIPLYEGRSPIDSRGFGVGGLRSCASVYWKYGSMGGPIYNGVVNR